MGILTPKKMFELEQDAKKDPVLKARLDRNKRIEEKINAYKAPLRDQENLSKIIDKLKNEGMYEQYSKEFITKMVNFNLNFDLFMPDVSFGLNHNLIKLGLTLSEIHIYFHLYFYDIDYEAQNNNENTRKLREKTRKTEYKYLFDRIGPKKKALLENFNQEEFDSMIFQIKQWHDNEKKRQKNRDKEQKFVDDMFNSMDETEKEMKKLDKKLEKYNFNDKVSNIIQFKK